MGSNVHAPYCAQLCAGVAGLVLFGRSSAAAASMASLIRSNDVQKTYLARVRGRFPWAAFPGRAQEGSLHSYHGRFDQIVQC